VVVILDSTSADTWATRLATAVDWQMNNRNIGLSHGL
jgi:hypothetical protein